ncbi:hypothetical protein Sa4125_10210 [Aureimonas sp. SA4125]|uniref:dimethylamine monooxygenase subunit DmmA family protein n=1 Tax=Aureimonas sp. SA4125 TaxID=2826993 RepID=UPI001CC55F56|nr:dimethylamine monooxygenase subunit DmmA family protein [Aureimonas sp. SA4125]BDA83479.1 hypothetical protein Sa4125_10210 [Aureimonas sp. SA4125]
MLLSEIKSRPTYGSLSPSPLATRHIVAIEGAGIKAFEAAFAGKAALLGRTTVVFTPSPDMPPDTLGRLEALGVDALHVSPSVETLLVRLAGLLATATMGTELSVTGSENFIGQAVAVGMAHGIGHRSIATEHSGSLARRVQCVHCKGFTGGVTESPVACGHCGLMLLVRDHYSRRLGAFMGVCIDAEAPGDIPAPEAFHA